MGRARYCQSAPLIYWNPKATTLVVVEEIKWNRNDKFCGFIAESEGYGGAAKAGILQFHCGFRFKGRWRES